MTSVQFLITHLVLCLVLVSVASGQRNLQAWSEKSYLGREHRLYCNDTLGLLVVEKDIHRLSWTKRGNKEPIVSNDHFNLESMYGIDNMVLVFPSVTVEMAGIYLCHVTDASGQPVGKVVKGLNVPGPMYENNGDKYGSKILTAFITAIIVFSSLATYVVVSKYRFLSEDQKRKKEAKKREQLARQNHVTEGGVDNLGLEISRGSSLALSRTSSVYEISF